MKGHILFCVTVILFVLSTLLISMSFLVTIQLDLGVLRKEVNPSYMTAKTLMESYIENMQQDFNKKLYEYISLELVPKVIQECRYTQDEQVIQKTVSNKLENEFYPKFIEDYCKQGTLNYLFDNISIELTVLDVNGKNQKVAHKFYVYGTYKVLKDKKEQSKHMIEACLYFKLPQTVLNQIYETFIFVNEDKPEPLKYALSVNQYVVVPDTQSLYIIGDISPNTQLLTFEQLEAEDWNSTPYLESIVEEHSWCYETPIEIGQTEINISNYYVTEDIKAPHTTLIINPYYNKPLKILANEGENQFNGWIFSNAPVEILNPISIEGGIVAQSLIIHDQLAINYNPDKVLSLIPKNKVLYHTILEKLDVITYLERGIDSYLELNLQDVILQVDYLKLKS